MNQLATETLAVERAASGIDRRIAAGALVATLVWLLVAYRETALAMAAIWARSETFAHGFIVPPIVLWLIWRQRARLATLPVRPAPWVALIAAVGAFGWLLGDLAAVNAVTQLAFTGLLVLSVIAIYGWRFAQAIAFPLAFLFFAVPIGEFFMPRLMEWTADFTVAALALTGIPVYREGLQFVIPSGTWSVVEACSGIRYLIASLMVGTLFAYLNYTSFKRRAIFIVVSGIVPIIANWLRAYMIVMLGHLSGNRLAVGVDHLIYGWLFFGVVIMIMFAIGARWREDAPATAAGAAVPPVVNGTGFQVGLATLLFVAATAMPHGVLWNIARHDAVSAPRLLWPATPGEWQQQPAPPADWTPVFENPSATLNVGLKHNVHSMGVYIAYYRNQGYDRKLVSSENMLVRSKDTLWTQVGRDVRNVRLDGKPVTVKTAQLRNYSASVGTGAGRLAVWQWYWIGDRLTASDAEAKAAVAISRLLGKGDDSASIILYAPEDQPGGGQAALEEFARTGAGAIQVMLEQARRER